jgi:hypothetical protein
MRYWWDPLCTRTTSLVDFYRASSLKQQSADRNVAPLGNVILIPCQAAFAFSPYCCVLSGEATNTKVIVFFFDSIEARTVVDAVTPLHHRCSCQSTKTNTNDNKWHVVILILIAGLTSWLNIRNMFSSPLWLNFWLRYLDNFISTEIKNIKIFPTSRL